MALTIKKLNGDSTFLLTFTTKPNVQTVDVGQRFTILLDPWLTGTSSIFHPLLAMAKHTVPSCMRSLAELPPPNVVIVSQDKSDHCHEATLKQLDRKLAHTLIFAHPSAAKRIRGWKYFNNDKVRSFPEYSSKKANSVVRIAIPTSEPGCAAGEVTLALVTTKWDVTKLHNGIGITYRAPAMTNTALVPLHLSEASNDSEFTAASRANAPLQSPYLDNFPPTPPESPAGLPPFASFHDSFGRGLRSTASAQFLRGSTAAHTSSSAPRTISISASSRRSTLESRESSEWRAPPVLHHAASAYHLSHTEYVDSPPASPPRTANVSSRTSYLTSSVPASHDAPKTLARAKTISVLYSPHGVSYGTMLPYITTHLVTEAALPLTLLLHAFDRVQNPWWLGGNVIAGFPGGVELAKGLLTRFWISAHDEDKEASGLIVQKVSTRKYTTEEVKRILAIQTKGEPQAEVIMMAAGEQKILLGA